MKETSFVIIKHLANLGTPLGTPKNEWTKEFNIVAWNGLVPKYDIREWSKDHERMSRGVTLTTEEVEAIADAFYNETED